MKERKASLKPGFGAEDGIGLPKSRDKTNSLEFAE